MEPPSLVLVIGSLQGGGAERQLSEMANYWVRQGIRVIIATWMGPGVEDFYTLDARVQRVFLGGNAPGVSVFARLRLALGRVLRLRRLLSQMQPDAVLSFVTESNVLTILASLGLGLRTVVSERVQPALHTQLPRIWSLTRRLIYAWSDVVVAQTEEAARWILKNCRKQATVIPNALRSLPPAVHDREQLIIAVGRLVHQKGFDLLMRSFAKIAGTFGGWRVAIIGEGEERATLLRLCGELGIADRVELMGQVVDVSDWMARAALIVQPSRFEGFPNVVLEGMAMGAAVICADCPSGPRDLIEDGVNGRLVPVEDVAELARVMGELMSQQSVRARLGAEASRVREGFRQDRIMAQWDKCLLPQIDYVRPNTRFG